MTFADWVTDTRRRFSEEPPQLAARESARAFVRGAIRRGGRLVGNSIWDREDWDVLVVLDACRHDLWTEVAPEYDLPADRPVWSNASCSIDWILRNLNAHPDEARRTAYVTGNPFADHDAADARSADLRDGPVGHLRPLYETEWQPIDGGPVETIPPAPLTDHGIDAWRRRDELGVERVIVHYMQPHQPFRSKPKWSAVNKNLKNLVEHRSKAGACAWQRARRGEIDTDELWAACQDNLRWVLDDVTERLLRNVDGDVVLTADHGNAMGEWGEWAHPPGAIGPAVRRVPWECVDATDERTVTPDVDTKSSQETAVMDRLQELGYA